MPKVVPFNQSPPRLSNQYDDDSVLQEYLDRVLPEDVRKATASELGEMGAIAEEFYVLSLATRLEEPKLTTFDAWGERIDRIEVTSLWKRAEEVAATKGLVATGYEGTYGVFDRVLQFALNYLFAPSSEFYSCPLAMTDGAARTLLSSGNQALIDKALPRLTSREPKAFWTSGQWMTESTGGSDVGLSETVAEEVGGQWRLDGRKWFTSAATSQMALTLARPKANPPGGRGLALFYVDCHDGNGRLQNIEVLRLKDKLGTRKLPTAELMLRGTKAELVLEAENGIRNIAPMLNITRTWNAITAVSFMRRGLALARDYAKKRIAFGAPLAEKPLHIDTLASLQAEFEGAFQLTFYVVELLGKGEHGELSEHQAAVLRLLTPIMKLTTAKQVVANTSEILECFGGAGYIEDTGLPSLLRDAQVLSIWEGTTNVLALDALRAIAKDDSMPALLQELAEMRDAIADEVLAGLAEQAVAAATHAATWLKENHTADPATFEAGARRFALTLGRAAELALLCRHAAWAKAEGKGPRATAAASRFAQRGIDLIARVPLDEAALLAQG